MLGVVFTVVADSCRTIYIVFANLNGIAASIRFSSLAESVGLPISQV